ncbi:MAG TPA: lysylphosphatidylglycerol synthase domain-containing protein [Gaiellaceae bacterium]|jgi:uncharacterized membrane protein YbhN (UPF0104 family)|nr:lysylphosphatidylglycerol synthase domain-containing protein [Gaiellaceae bacterium]
MNRRDDEIFGIDRKKAVITAVLAVALLAAAIFLIGELADFGTMLDALRRANKNWFFVCFGGELLAYAGYIAAYRDFARVDGGPKLPLWTVTRVVAVGFGAFIAGSSAGTLGVDFWALQRAGDTPHRAARRVLALNTLEWGVLAVAAMLAAAALLASGDGAPLGMKLGWLIVVPVCGILAALVTAPSRVERFTAIPDRDMHRTLRWLRVALADAIGGVVMVRHVLQHPRRYPFAVLGFPVYWAGDILAIWAALRAFDAGVGLGPLVLAYTTAYVVTSLPLPAGGAGGVEAGLAFSLQAVGIDLAPALLATLIYRFFTLWLPIGLAVLAVTQVKTLAEELPHVEHEPAPG